MGHRACHMTSQFGHVTYRGAVDEGASMRLCGRDSGLLLAHSRMVVLGVARERERESHSIPIHVCAGTVITPTITGAHPMDPSELSSLVSRDLRPLSNRLGREWAGTTWGGGRSPLGLSDFILSTSVMLSLEL